MKPEKKTCVLNLPYEGDFKSGEGQMDGEEISGQTSLAWLNLSYSANVGWCCASKKTTKPLLQRLNGHFNWHSLNGLLGPSGAGKTTFLNCLVGTVAAQEGSQLYVDAKTTNLVSCLIEQTVNQSITGQLTVNQILQYAYAFKNGRSQDYLKRKVILSVLDDMMLDESILSTTFERCSGGEQKRVAIAQELVALGKPHFLIIDEPTTGLDSQAAYQLMRCLKRLSAHYRMTILASIHVPNDQTLALCDKLYVLAKGGVCLYSGSTEQLQSSLQYCLPRFTETEEKPIEAIIKVACKDLGNSQVVRLANHFSETEFKAVYCQLPRLRTLPLALSTAPKSFSLSDLTTDVCRRSRITFLALYRTFLLQLAFFVLNVFIYSTIFDHSMVWPSGCSPLNSGNATCISEESATSEALLKENLNYLFYTRLLMSNLLVISSYSIFSFLLKNIPFEHRNRWYSLGSSYWSICLVTLLQMSIFVLSISVTAYFASEQHTVDLNGVNWTRFGHFLASLWLYYSFIQGVGEAVAVLTSKTEIGIVISCIILVIVQLLDEFFFTSEQLPNTATVIASNLLGVKHFTRYMIYAIYGLNRCHPETEFSWILAKRSVNVETLWADAVALGSVRILVIRLVGFLLFCGKRALSTNHRLICSFRKVRKPLATKEPKFIPFEGNNSSQFDDNNNRNSNEKSKSCSSKQNGIRETLFAWQTLTLHSSISFYKLGSSSASSHPILRSLNGHLTFGSLTALMGMSGAGKTSLLRVLNGQCQTRLDSETRFFVSTLEPIRTCYITQDVSNHLLSGLTVQQLIVYASKLKNSYNSTVDHEEIAQRLLLELDLVGIEKNQVEDCSGGERKRLALALELTPQRMPNLVCIDEPTSGLDSNSAHKVVSCLGSIAHHHGLAIVTSLHQPSNDLLCLFDQLYVLARGGQCVFSGPPGHIKEHLSTVPAIDLTESKYPIEVLIKHSCSTVDNPIVQQLARQNAAQLSPEYLINTHSLVDGLPPNRVCFSFATLYTLTQRYFSCLKSYRTIQMLIFTCLYLLLGACLSPFFNAEIANASGCASLEDNFNSTCHKSRAEILTDRQLETNVNYSVFASIYFYMLFLVQSGLMLFYELPLFLAEHRNGSYSTGAFYLSNCAFEILPMIPSMILYVYIIDIYEAITPGVYWYLLLIFFLSVLAYQGMAHSFVLLFPDNSLLIATSNCSYYVCTILLSSVIVPIRRMHYIYRLLSNLSVNRFTLEASLLLQYGFGRCPAEQFSLPLAWIDLTDEDYYSAIAMLVVNILIYRCIAFGLLVRKANPIENERQRAVASLQQLKQLEAPEAIIAGLSDSSGKAPIQQRI